MKKMVDPRKIEWIGGTDPDEKVPLVVKPASDEAIATTTEPVSEPVVEPVSEPAVEPVSEPLSQPAVEPVSEPVVEPVSQPAVEPVSEPAVEPVSEPVVEPVSEPVVEPVSEPVVEPVPEPVPEQAAEEPVVAENVKPESSAPPSVADALNIIADKIATAVVNKMRENPASGSNQDADIAVPLAVSAVVKQTQLAPE